MNCPYCGTDKSRVIDSRPTDEGAIRRRHTCQSCGERFTSYEFAVKDTPKTSQAVRFQRAIRAAIEGYDVPEPITWFSSPSGDRLAIYATGRREEDDKP